MGHRVALLRKPESRGSRLAAKLPSDHTSASIFSGADVYSGTDVTEDTALTFSALYRAVDLLSGAVAKLPLFLMTETPQGKEKALEHPLFDVLHSSPNGYMSSYDFRYAMMANKMLYGSAYAEIEYNGSGRPVALWPIPSARVTVNVENDQVIYTVTPPDYNTTDLLPEQVVHLKWFTINGLEGRGLVQLAKNSIGTGLAMQEYAGRLFGQGSTFGCTIEHPARLGKEAIENLKRSFAEMYGGLSNAHRMMVLEEGMKIARHTLAPDEAQFLEGRKFTVTEIARWTGIPPHLLFDLERATYTNIEHQGRDFVDNSLMPHLTGMEAELGRKLLTVQERKTMRVLFNVSALLRGDTTARFNSYQVGLSNGFLSVNEVRELEDWNRIGPEGDGYLRPMNLVPLGTDPEPEPEPVAVEAPIEEPAPEELEAGARAAFAVILRDAYARFERRETEAASRRIAGLQKTHDVPMYEQWIAERRDSQWRNLVESLETIVGAYAELKIGVPFAEPGLLADELAAAFADSVYGGLRGAVVPPGNFKQASAEAHKEATVRRALAILTGGKNES